MAHGLLSMLMESSSIVAGPEIEKRKERIYGICTNCVQYLTKTRLKLDVLV